MGLLAAVACLSAPAVGGGTPNLDSMQALYDHISEQCSSLDAECLPPDDRGLPANGELMDPQRTVGFLSEANYHSARHSLPSTTFAFIADNAEELQAKVKAFASGVEKPPLVCQSVFGSGAGVSLSYAGVRSFLVTEYGEETFARNKSWVSATSF